MANTEVGSAYVTIYPQTDGNFSKQVGQSMGDDIGGGLSAKAVAIGNILSNAAMSAASAVGEQFSNAFWNYADYEQLVGGVDTLFKDASSTVQENAKNAFKTAGLSANEYMENVTSFSASLISSVGGDTAKAAEIADKAMVDMSDNANKMGSDMQSITNAYQGFAKQNYTMLDNLKLGYGGTKEEMQRLLDDAGKIAGVEFNIDSYADVIEAIHVMQESMDITGTTMKEGSTTISGSINQLKGAWDNFLTALGDGGATMDMDKVINDLFESIGAVASNVIPALMRVAQSIAESMPEILGMAFESLKTIVSDGIRSMFGDEAAATFDEAITGLSTNVQEAFGAITSVIESLAPVVMGLWETISATFPDIYEIISTAFNEVSEIVQTVWPYVQDVIVAAVNAIQAIIEVAWPLIKSIVETAMEGMSAIIQTVWPVILQIVETAMNGIEAAIRAIEPIVNFVQGVFDGVRSAIENPTEAAQGFVEGATSAIDSAFQALEPIVSTVSGIFDGVRSAIEDPIGTAQGFIEDAMSTIESIINGLDLSLPDIALPHFSVYGGEFPWGIGGQGSPPEFSVSWYAKGGFVDGATLIGAGERGPEMILPRTGRLMDEFASAVSDRVHDGGGIDVDDLIDALQNMRFVLNIDGRAFAEATVDEIDRAFGAKSRRAMAR